MLGVMVLGAGDLFECCHMEEDIALVLRWLRAASSGASLCLFLIETLMPKEE